MPLQLALPFFYVFLHGSTLRKSTKAVTGMLQMLHINI